MTDTTETITSHHFKFFPNRGTPTDKSGNVSGGLVVDRDIVSPTSLDVYLQSHGGLIGSTVPIPSPVNRLNEASAS